MAKMNSVIQKCFSLSLLIMLIIPTVACDEFSLRISPTAIASPHPGWTAYTDVNNVRDIAFDHDGNLWTGSRGGVVKWNLADGAHSVYTRLDGLASNDVLRVDVAADGALWFGTAGGASRFDGNTWTTYTSADGLPHNHVNAMAAAGNGAMWFASMGEYSHGGGYRGPGVISRFDGSAWEQYPIQRIDPMPPFAVSDIAIAPDGAIWLAYYQGEELLAHFDGATWHTFTSDKKYAPQFPFFEAPVIAVTPNGDVWLGSRGGLGVAHINSAGLLAADSEDAWTCYTTQDGLVSNDITSIAVAPDGAVWFGSAAGVSRFAGNVWTTYTANDGMASDKINTIAVAPNGDLWFGTPDGLIHFNGGTFTSHRVNGLAGCCTSAIALASDGALWVDGDGISRFDGRHWDHDTSDDPIVALSAIAIADGSTLWVADYEGVFRFNGQTWTELLAVEDYGIDNGVRDIAVTVQGDAWIATSNGVYHFDGGTWTKYAAGEGLGNDNVASIAIAPNGDIWAGHLWGVARFDGATWTNYSQTSTGTDLDWNVAVAADGAVWATTHAGPDEAGIRGEGSALARFDGREWIALPTPPDGNTGDIRNMTIAPDGAVWLCNFRGDLFRFDGAATNGGAWLDPFDAVPAGYYIMDIVAAPDGSLWFSTGDDGLLRYTPPTPLPSTVIVPTPTPAELPTIQPDRNWREFYRFFLGILERLLNRQE